MRIMALNRHLAMMVRTIGILSAGAIITLGCNGAPDSSSPVLRQRALSGRTLALTSSEAIPSLDGSTTLTLPALADAEDGDLVFEQFTHRAESGELLTLELSALGASPGILVLIDTERILDSDKGDEVDPSARISIEIAKQTDLTILVASQARQGGRYSLSLEAEEPTILEPLGQPGDSYALIASVENYPRSRVDLVGPHRDADLMAELLQEQFGFASQNILILRDERVTRRRLVDSWLGHLGQAGKDGVAVFYFSGHGTQLEESPGATANEADGLDESLLLADGSVIIDHELGHLAEGLTAGRKVLILDNCYAGTGTRSQDGTPKRAWADKLDFEIQLPQRLLNDGLAKGGAEQSTSYLLLAASDESEVAYISNLDPKSGEAFPVSVFTRFLVDELSHGNGSTTFENLLGAVRLRTLGFVRQEFLRDQSPHLEGNIPNESVASFLRPR